MLNLALHLRWLLLLALAASACDGDDTCVLQPLEKFCEAGCPKNRADAIAAVCAAAADGGQPHGEGWTERQNSCGGVNVESTSGPFGVIYSFDHAGKLVGAAGWTDTTNDSKCASFDTYYGKRCDGSGNAEHDCPDGS